MASAPHKTSESDSTTEPTVITVESGSYGTLTWELSPHAAGHLNEFLANDDELEWMTDGLRSALDEFMHAVASSLCRAAAATKASFVLEQMLGSDPSSIDDVVADLNQMPGVRVIEITDLSGLFTQRTQGIDLAGASNPYLGFDQDRQPGVPLVELLTYENLGDAAGASWLMTGEQDAHAEYLGEKPVRPLDEEESSLLRHHDPLGAEWSMAEDRRDDGS